MSCSSLRHAKELLAALEGGREDISGCDCYGPMSGVVLIMEAANLSRSQAGAAVEIKRQNP